MSTVRGDRGRRASGERGASFVEFALIFPIFMTIVLGMFSGGLSYNRKISMTNAVSEAARYGATLAPSTLNVPPPGANIDEWVRVVAAAVVQNADGDLDAGVSGREICVAYVHPEADTTLPHNQASHLVRYGTTTTPVSQTFGGAARCIPNDGRPNSERRVQITVARNSPLDALFFKYDLTLRAQSINRFEATEY